MASVPVYSTLNPNVTPYVYTLNAIANLKCMAPGGVCSLTFTKEVCGAKGHGFLTLFSRWVRILMVWILDGVQGLVLVMLYSLL